MAATDQRSPDARQRLRSPSVHWLRGGRRSLRLGRRSRGCGRRLFRPDLARRWRRRGHGRRRRAYEDAPRPVDLGRAAAAALLLLLAAAESVHEAEVRPRGGAVVAAVEELGQGEDGPLAGVRLRVEVVPGAALAEDLLLAVGVLLLAGDEPGVGGAGTLRVHAVALLGLVPEDVALVLVAHALRLARLLVETEEEGVAAGALRVPLVAHARRRPVVLK